MQDFGCRHPGQIGHKTHPSPIGLDHIAAYHRFRCVIATFDQDVRAELGDEFERGRFTEEGHVIHTRQRCDDLGALLLRSHWASWAFELAYRGIVVERYHEDVAEGARLLQVLDMANVQDVKAPVGKNDTLSPLAMVVQLSGEFDTPEDFGRGRHALGVQGSAEFLQ